MNKLPDLQLLCLLGGTTFGRKKNSLLYTSYIIVKCCQQEFCFSLPSITLPHRTENFLGKIRQCDNLLVKRLLCM